jgi:hypothetical protein
MLCREFRNVDVDFANGILPEPTTSNKCFVVFFSHSTKMVGYFITHNPIILHNINSTVGKASLDKARKCVSGKFIDKLRNHQLFKRDTAPRNEDST